MPKKGSSEDSGQLELFIPYPQKPFLEHKKKVRGRNREGFDLVEKAARFFQTQLDRDEIHSQEAKLAIQQFLLLIQGDKTKLS